MTILKYDYHHLKRFNLKIVKGVTTLTACLGKRMAHEEENTGTLSAGNPSTTEY
jgi:hypothetical protein